MLDDIVKVDSLNGGAAVATGSNAVNPQVRNLFHVGKIYLPFCLVH